MNTFARHSILIDLLILWSTAQPPGAWHNIYVHLQFGVQNLLALPEITHPFRHSHISMCITAQVCIWCLGLRRVWRSVAGMKLHQQTLSLWQPFGTLLLTVPDICQIYAGRADERAIQDQCGVHMLTSVSSCWLRWRHIKQSSTNRCLRGPGPQSLSAIIWPRYLSAPLSCIMADEDLIHIICYSIST